MASNGKVMINLIWKFLERVGAQVVSFIVSIVLARLLMPDAYGTVALITVFTTVLQVFVDSGLGNALIQKKNTDDIDFSTVFYTNIGFCIILYSLIYLLAPSIAMFYNKDELVPLIRVVSITILISGIRNVQQAYVSKKMMFKKFFFSTLGGTISAAIIGIVLALNGFGVWALVAQQLTNLFVSTLILWFVVKWRPKLVFSFQRLKQLYKYGWKLLASALLDTVYNNCTQLIIGKIYSSGDLAYYNKGKQFPELIVVNVNSSIDSVLLPAMSEVQDKKEHIKNMTRRSIKMSMYIMAPCMIGMAAVASNIIEILLTNRWAGSVIFMQIFCVVFMFYPIHTANLNAIKAMGRSDLFLKLEIIKKAIGTILLIATMFVSVKAMAYSLLVSCFTSQIINVWPNKKLLDYGYIEQIKDIYPTLLLAIIMGGGVYLFNFINLPVIVILLVQIIVAIFIYIVGSVFSKNESFYYLIGMLKRKR